MENIFGWKHVKIFIHTVTNDGSETDVLVLVDQARDWAQHLGMHDRSKNHPQKLVIRLLEFFKL